MHPFTQSQITRGRFHTYFVDLRENSDVFNYCMNLQSFEDLAEKITDIKSQDIFKIINKKLH